MFVEKKDVEYYSLPPRKTNPDCIREWAHSQSDIIWYIIMKNQYKLWSIIKSSGADGLVCVCTQEFPLQNDDWKIVTISVNYSCYIIKFFSSFWTGVEICFINIRYVVVVVVLSGHTVYWIPAVMYDIVVPIVNINFNDKDTVYAREKPKTIL